VANDLSDAIDAVLWNEEDGIWYDYDFVNGVQRKIFSPSNLVPLWTETFSDEDLKANQVVMGSNKGLKMYQIMNNF
jgi:neutral trehalase